MFKGIKVKLIALPALPILVVLYFMVTGIATKNKTVDEMEDMNTLSRLAVKINALVHETQKERGASGVFMGSDGKKFKTEVTNQRRQTDPKRADFQKFLKSIDLDSYGRQFNETLDKAVNKLAGLDAHRIKVSNQAIPDAQGIAFYTQHNQSMFDVIDMIVKSSGNVDMREIGTAYLNLLKGKEQAGLERAVLSRTFSADRFEAGVLRQLIFLVSTQENYFKEFLSMATPDQTILFNRKMSDPVVAEVQRMRNIAFKMSEGFGVDAGHWFSSMTSKINLMKEVEESLTEDLTKFATELKAGARNARNMIILVALIVVLGVVIVVFFITRSITKPINRIIYGLNEGAEQVASASGQVSSASQQLAEGSSEQAAAIEETSSSLEEMSSMTKQNSKNASQADILMKDANQVVDQANDSMTELIGSMEDISKASQETSKIIKTIDEIAFQTNLLALNAAVEAARAGEAGAGFAVVADEVRNLAMRAADAAKNTAELIEGTVKNVQDGTQLVGRTNEAFSKVADSASKVGELVSEIAAASNEQAQGIEQVNTAVSEMDKVTQSNAANAEESASASEEMSAQAEQMKTMVGELVILVGGSDNGANQDHSSAMYIAKAKVHKTLEFAAPVKRTKSKAMVVHKAKKASPEQIIPLDDGDFKDF
jgi:methyl-accepting chemotaxis protein